MTRISSPLPAGLDISVECEALQYYVANWTTWPCDMPDIGQDYLNFVMDYWHRAPIDSCLHVVMSAFMLAVYGSVKPARAVLESADETYGHALSQVKSELAQLSAEVPADNLIVATMLMTTYEVPPRDSPTAKFVHNLLTNI